MTAPDHPFVHLHLHSEYSLLDGGNRLDKLVARVKELGMNAVAVTDHGNMHAAVEFYELARAAGIKPILGVEAYVAPGSRLDKSPSNEGPDGGFHLVMLAESDRGWANLLTLVSDSYLKGFYRKPRMDRQTLAEHADGIIVINGHLGSELAHHLMMYDSTHAEHHYENAAAVARWHQDVFGPNAAGQPRFYVELQHHVPEQIAINPHLIRLARELGLPLVCDNDSHFLRAEDHDAHDTLICISTGKQKSDPGRMRYTPELYVKSPAEMWELFGGSTYNNDRFGDAGREALLNTAAIAERCNVTLPIGANHAPLVRVDIPAPAALPAHDAPAFAGDLTAWFKAFCSAFELKPFRDADATAGDADAIKQAIKQQCDRALRLLAEAGMVWRYGPDILRHRHELTALPNNGDHADASSDPATTLQRARWARLNRELTILADKLISAYFLIVWDFVNWGRQRGIPANARGSGVGTMVGYVLGLSNACPVEYGLLFERFTDPDRTEYPDIDIDLCQDGRQDVINYVRDKYGYVAQIITFGTLGAKAAIRDVARVHGHEPAWSDRLAKLVPEQLNITLDKALAQDPDFKRVYDTDDDARRVINEARVIEGQARHSSVHAAGVIVATTPLHRVVPLYKPAQGADTDVITQWDGPTCEKMGLLKMDFLGLRTLSVIERCMSLIRDTLPDDAVWSAVGRSPHDAGPHPLDLDRLNYADPTVFELFRRGDTTGVFQFESGGMRRLLVEMKPDRLADLIAANALYRPGPMDLIPDYNRRKHGQDPVPQIHPIVTKHTSETYGIMVYQEQVMQIVHELGGIPLRSAYSLIKAISKKKEKDIAKARPVFINGAATQGLGTGAAEDLFELILKFAGYGFNKSHSTGYAIIAYQTAYLKTYFPNHYMAAFLTYESQAQKASDWIPYLEDCRRTAFVDPARPDPRSGVAATIRTGVEVKPPDINLSRADFAVVFTPGEPRLARNGHVRFGLRAIKGAGSKAIDAIIAERDIAAPESPDDHSRPFSSIFDFCERVPSTAVNKATIEALIKSGAFDGVHSRAARASLVASIESAVGAGQKVAHDKAAGQGQLFGLGAPPPPAATPAASTTTVALAKVPAWSEAETLQQEKDTLGFYVSSHPLEQWGSWTRLFTRTTSVSLKQSAQEARVLLPAIVQSMRTIVCKNGKSAGMKMAIVTIEDAAGACEAVLFPAVYAQYATALEDDGPKFFDGRVDHGRGEPQLIVDRVIPIDGRPKDKGRLLLTLSESRLNGTAPAALRSAADALLSYRQASAELAPGSHAPRVPVELLVETANRLVSLRPDDAWQVHLVPDLVRSLETTLGTGSVRLVGGVSIEVATRNERRPNRPPARASRSDEE